MGAQLWIVSRDVMDGGSIPSCAAFVLDKGQFSCGRDPSLNKELCVEINHLHLKQ